MATALRGIPVEDDPETSLTVAATRAALGEAPYQAIHHEGVRLSREDALRLAGVPEPVLQASLINAIAIRDGLPPLSTSPDPRPRHPAAFDVPTAAPGTRGEP